MSMNLTAIAMVLFAAVLHASWNAMVKSSGDKWLTFCSLTLVGAFACTALLPLVPTPHPDSWKWLALSTGVHYLYYLFLLKSYKHGDFSKVYPIARGSAPLLVAWGSHLFAGETLSTIAYLAITTSSLGIMALTFEKGLPRQGERKVLVYAFMTGLFIASYTVVDGLGVRASGDKFSYIFWLFSLEGVPFLIWAIWKYKIILPFFQRNWKVICGGAFASHTAYGLVIAALTIGHMASVSALRETSVIIAAIIGAVFLKEGFGHWRITAAGFVGGGVVVLNLFG